MSEYPIQTCPEKEASYAVFYFDHEYGTATLDFHLTAFEAYRNKRVLTKENPKLNVKIMDLELWSGFVFLDLSTG